MPHSTLNLLQQVLKVCSGSILLLNPSGSRWQGAALVGCIIVPHRPVVFMVWMDRFVISLHNEENLSCFEVLSVMNRTL